tara:strand:+ start:567 stop:794 length:228 start_codon:yes stop_codon:yes gene_type:complete
MVIKTYTVFEESLTAYKVEANSPEQALRIYWDEEKPVGAYWEDGTMDISATDVWVSDDNLSTEERIRVEKMMEDE